jgi:phage-related protein
MPSEWEVEFYRRSSGRCPALDFLRSLSEEEKVFVNRALDRLRTYGRDLDRPHVAHLRDHIYELRIHTSASQVRLLYFFVYVNRIIVTHGFKKKTRGVPQQEVDAAIRYRADYLDRES